MTQTVKYLVSSKKRPIKWWVVPIIFTAFLFSLFIFPTAIANPNIIFLTIISLALYLTTRAKLTKKLISLIKRKI